MGAVAGYIGYVQVLLLHSVYSGGVVNPNSRLLFAVYVTSGVVSFIAGGAIGQRAKGKPAGQAAANHASEWMGRIFRDPQSSAQATTIIQTAGPILLAILNATFVAVGLAKK